MVCSPRHFEDWKLTTEAQRNTAAGWLELELCGPLCLRGVILTCQLLGSHANDAVPVGGWLPFVAFHDSLEKASPRVLFWNVVQVLMALVPGARVEVV